MRIPGLLAAAFLVLPASAVAQTCTDAAIYCNGRWVSVPCNASDAEISAACGREYVSGNRGPSDPVLVQFLGGTVDLIKDVNLLQKGAWIRESNDRIAEVSSGRSSPPSVSCVLLMDDIAESTEAFAKEGEEYGMSFAKDEFEKTIDKLRDQHKTKSKHEKAFEAFKAWTEKIQKWSTDLREWEKCIHTPGCSLTDLAGKDRKALRKWLAEKGWIDEDSADRVDRAADFLESYTTRMAEKNLAYASKAAECAGR